MTDPTTEQRARKALAPFVFWDADAGPDIATAILDALRTAGLNIVEGELEQTPDDFQPFVEYGTDTSDVAYISTPIGVIAQHLDAVFGNECDGGDIAHDLLELLHRAGITLIDGEAIPVGWIDSRSSGLIPDTLGNRTEAMRQPTWEPVYRVVKR